MRTTMARAAFNEMIIAEVEKRPLLWNTWLEQYRDSDLRDRLWIEVAQLLKEVKAECESRRSAGAASATHFKKRKERCFTKRERFSRRN